MTTELKYEPMLSGVPAEAAKLGVATYKVVQADQDLNADALFKEVEGFLSRFVAYPSIEARIAHVLWIAHTHLMSCWDATPRLAFLSPEPASGKTRALEITELLVPNAVKAVNATPAYLIRKVGNADVPPTILFDEIDTVFGPRAKENEEIRGLLNAGHRRGAVVGRCVIRGKSVETEEIAAYGAVALAGLGKLPDTILSRSIIIPMRRRAPHEKLDEYRQRKHEIFGRELGERIAAWAIRATALMSGHWPEMPMGLHDRDADVWEPLLTVADALGRDWPRRARAAALVLVSSAKQNTPSLGVRLLQDIRHIFGVEKLNTDALLSKLFSLPESPWVDIKGQPLNPVSLSQMLSPYGIKPKTVRIGEDVLRGYYRVDFHDAWTRYLSPSRGKAATPATTATSALKNTEIAPNLTIQPAFGREPAPSNAGAGPS